MKRALNENELNKVSGGNYNDGDLEASETPEGVRYLHNVGDHVEVYVGMTHTITDGGTIVERKATDCSVGCTPKYVGYYKIHFDKGGTDSWVCAKQIERNE